MATKTLLERLGYQVQPIRLGGRERPVCCGRTFLSVGLIDEARKESQRLMEAIRLQLDDDIPIIGIEPSCLLTTRDEYASLGLGDVAERLAERALLLDEFLAAEANAGRLERAFPSQNGRVLVHGHCHQKAFGVEGSMLKALNLIDGLETEMIETSCCGMAGAFGYGAETYDVSMRMAELSLLPKVRAADAADFIVANGFSCRHQIRDGTGRDAEHMSRIMLRTLEQRGQEL